MLDITIKILILLQENMSKWTNVNGRHIYIFRGKEKQNDNKKKQLNSIMKFYAYLHNRR